MEAVRVAVEVPTAVFFCDLCTPQLKENCNCNWGIYGSLVTCIVNLHKMGFLCAVALKTEQVRAT